MTTRITVQINSSDSLLNKAKTVQAESRLEEKSKKESEEDKKAAKKLAQEKDDSEEDKWKGAVADPEGEEKRKNKPKGGCGAWVYTDYVYHDNATRIGVTVFEGQSYRTGTDGYIYRNRSSGPDLFQISVGSGDGTKWETHIIGGDLGKPDLTGLGLNSSMVFDGWLSTVSFYTGTFGTVYSIPDDAVITEYDPAVYLANGLNENWGLYFGEQGQQVTLYKKDVLRPSTGSFMNLFPLGLPVSDKKSILLFAVLIGYVNEVMESYSAGPGEDYFLDPTNTSYPTIARKVYYKYPGGNETGWQPITGYFRFLNGSPSSIDPYYTLSDLGSIFPVDTDFKYYAGYIEGTVGFVVSDKNCKKLDEIPSPMAEILRSRCPLPTFGGNNPYFQDWQWPTSQYPGYPGFANQPDNGPWSINPFTSSMGLCWDALTVYPDNSHFLENDVYDFYDPFYATRCFNGLIGVTPGAFDYIDANCNDHMFYDHYGEDGWSDDSWNPNPITSTYGKVRLHAPDARDADTGFNWLRNHTFTPTKFSARTPQANPYQSQVDLAWLYLKKEDRENYLENYLAFTYGRPYYTYPGYQNLGTEYETFSYQAEIQEIRADLTDNPPQDDPTFKFMYYPPELTEDGIIYRSSGWSGSWTVPGYTNENGVVIENGSAFVSDLPYAPSDGWIKHKKKMKLSPNRIYPETSVSGSGENHPMKRGDPFLSLVVNTAWGSNYTEKLVALGFNPGDL